MSDNTPEVSGQKPEVKKTALVAEHVHGDSKIFNVSLRGWLAAMVLATLCFVVCVIIIRVKDVEQVVPALKELFVPTVSAVILFYFATKSPNKETKS